MDLESQWLIFRLCGVVRIAVLRILDIGVEVVVEIGRIFYAGVIYNET